MEKYIVKCKIDPADKLWNDKKVWNGKSHVYYVDRHYSKFTPNINMAKTYSKLSDAEHRAINLTRLYGRALIASVIKVEVKLVEGEEVNTFTKKRNS
jgi:hypothetical protein